MSQIFVTMTRSDNKDITYPCNGYLEILSPYCDGPVLFGNWRGLNPNGGYYAPCEVRNVEFVYPAV